MSKSITSFGSLSPFPGPEPTPLAFTNWGEGQFFSWYNDLTDHRDKSIHKIQIRKDITGPVPHRFIVLHMSNNRIHRFDRRPDRSPDSNTTTVGLLTNQAVASKDTYVLNIPLSPVEQGSLCEIELILDGKVDLLAVISACYAISNDDSTRKYTFLRHNCFFFSWTVLMVVSRHYLPYEVPPLDSIVHRFQSHHDRLASLIVGDAIALFLDILAEIITSFREKAGKAVYQGLHLIGQAAWHLPDSVLRSIIRQLFTAQLHFGLRDKLIKKVKAMLATMVSPIYEALTKHMTSDILDAHLWIEDTKDTIREGFKTELMKILWEWVLDVISSSLGDIEAEELAAQLTGPLRFSLLGQKVAQFCAVTNGALYGGLQAAKKAGENISQLSDEQAFEKTWSAVREGGLIAAQTVAAATSAQINDPRRDNMWISVWEVYHASWDKAYKTAQPRALQVLEKMVEELLDTSVGLVIKDMRESKLKVIQARMPKERKWLRTHRKVIENMTNATLQEYMQDIIKKDTVSTEALDAVHSSMGRIWKKARQYLPIPATPLDTIAEHD